MRPFEPGDPGLVGGLWLSGRLGEGPRGVVFLGRRQDGGEIAVKLLHAHLTEDPVVWEGYQRAMEAVVALHAPHTAKAHATGLVGARPYLMSDYVEGTPLAEAALPLSVPDVERLAAETATALAALHAAGVPHGALTPANVFLTGRGAVLTDYGLAPAPSPTSFADDIRAWAALVSSAAGTPEVLPPRLFSLVESCSSATPPPAAALLTSLTHPAPPPTSPDPATPAYAAAPVETEPTAPTSAATADDTTPSKTVTPDTIASEPAAADGEAEQTPLPHRSSGGTSVVSAAAAHRPRGDDDPLGVSASGANATVVEPLHRFGSSHDPLGQPTPNTSTPNATIVEPLPTPYDTSVVTPLLPPSPTPPPASHASLTDPLSATTHDPTEAPAAHLLPPLGAAGLPTGDPAAQAPPPLSTAALPAEDPTALGPLAAIGFPPLGPADQAPPPPGPAGLPAEAPATFSTAGLTSADATHQALPVLGTAGLPPAEPADQALPPLGAAGRPAGDPATFGAAGLTATDTTHQALPVLGAAGLPAGDHAALTPLGAAGPPSADAPEQALPPLGAAGDSAALGAVGLTVADGAHQASPEPRVEGMSGGEAGAVVAAGQVPSGGVPLGGAGIPSVGAVPPEGGWAGPGTPPPWDAGVLAPTPPKRRSRGALVAVAASVTVVLALAGVFALTRLGGDAPADTTVAKPGVAATQTPTVEAPPVPATPSPTIDPGEETENGGSPAPKPPQTTAQPPADTPKPKPKPKSKKNLVANGGFETGFGAWLPRAVEFLGPKKAHSGGKAVLLRPGEGYDAAVELVVTGLKPHTLYTLTGWVTAKGGSTYIGVMDYGGPTRDSSSARKGWTRLSVIFQTGDQTTARIYCWRQLPGTGACDDMAVHRR
ncbi:protein kinase [Actinocorallia sp. API 0066]|uniref:protein kinase domain-containing protein n=1 Tax=Actinocorallia sp. API 0066 TaxID=2896846 RepID=UPI00271486D4|nr:protein kinase [Actinocorallia sp. API 0066]